jgi:hypothetical protein
MSQQNFLDNDPAGPIDGADSFPGIQGGGDVLFSMAALLAKAWDRASHTGAQAQSTITGLVAALASKAADAVVVKLTGNQTIDGIKTFSSAPVVPDGSWTISDTAGLQDAIDAVPVDGSLVHDTGNETIAGVKTFTSSPIVPTPTTAFQAAPKGYVESLVAAGGALRVEDEGSTVVSAATGINFVGADVTVTDAGSNEATVTVGGAGQITVTSYGAVAGASSAGQWNVGDLGLVWTSGKPVTLVGAGPDVTYLYFSTDRAAGTFALSGPGVRVRNMTIYGPGTSLVLGTSPANLRAVEMQNRANLQHVTIERFHAGYQVVGDHTYAETVKTLNCFYGEEYANGTTFGDHTRIDCDNTGNLRASIFVALDGKMDAATYIRGHLGFTPFCIECEAGGADDWVGMIDSQFIGTAFEYGGNGFLYNSDQKVMVQNVTLDRCRPFSRNVAYKIAALAVQPDVFVRTVDSMHIIGDGPIQWEPLVIRSCTWEGWKRSYAAAVAAGFTFLKGFMGLSGTGGTMALTHSNSRAVAMSAEAAITAGQVVEYSGAAHYVRPHNPSGANGGSLIAGVALNAAPSVNDVCIVVQEDYEGTTPIQVAGAGPYGADDMLFAVGTVGKVDNAAGAGGGYADKAIIGRVAADLTVSSGKLDGVIIKISDRAT